MPLYEYKCKNCGDVFEVMQKFVDPPLTIHEKCGGGPLEKLISTSAFAFKGSGFYITDYAKNAGSSSNSSAAKNEHGEKSEKTEKSDKSEKSSGDKTEKPAEPSKPAPATSSTESK